MSEANIVDITPFLAKHQLPLKYQYLSEQYFVPLAHDILESKKSSTPLFVGINGCQGSGKTTLADFLVTWFSNNTSLNTIALSIDDFYLGKESRKQLAEDVHPLFVTRGVPGTHDTELMNTTITKLLAGEVGVALPRFNKHQDDCVAKQDWVATTAPIDIVILEGWCVGSEPQPLFSLSEPLNELEQLNDKEGVWRRCINSCLANEYKSIFNKIDYKVMLKAPSFSDVFTWRKEQEQKLIAKNGVGAGTMTDEQLVYFISHFERITRENLNTLSRKANSLIELDSNRDIASMHLTSDDTLQPIIFTDLDGTLLDHTDYNTSNVSELLQQLQSAHIPVVFNTSKTFCEVVEIKNELNIQQPFIVENGAAVFIPQSYFELKPIGCKEVGGYWCYALASPLSSLLSDLDTLDAQYKAHYKLFSELSSEQISELTGLNNAQARRAQTRDYSDPLYWYGSDELLNTFVSDVTTLGYDIKIGGRFIHIAKNTDKSAAQQWLVKQFTQHFRKPLTVIALGDSDNDKQMLEHADIAIIINNPSSKKPVKLSHNKARYSQSPAPQGWIEEITILPSISSILNTIEEQKSHG
ncbi:MULTISPECIES: HAD-IIB family hydrolase [unclassified Pseudoalteromonas]|uniref:HAD-IIB family hydrolase n=1 Tax=unclassified Pseudoalteromonas TaxID=194690 RepID=UPI000731CF55|nr:MULTISPECIES: HAD-IIB family hydrolase [unclassified Pseudoalteromonas]KTD98012.1 haloacid dehalogenase [Pseudoalteromonas sp. H71]TMN84498.1 haloacid dehalogenase [Pseudoalteromonas sp. S410]TMN91286.1 haloacid dehalogenase [Pseudoalteromonas sp. S408]TMN98164.1 haloacid dehalogenase [Pseudoalteromonas sp. S407]TMO00051.1 haloacid dehalogenase [Pseudoalteromonas sp. S409]